MLAKNLETTRVPSTPLARQSTKPPQSRDTEDSKERFASALRAASSTRGKTDRCAEHVCGGITASPPTHPARIPSANPVLSLDRPARSSHPCDLPDGDPLAGATQAAHGLAPLFSVQHLEAWPNLATGSAAGVAAARQVLAWAARSIVDSVSDRRGARIRVYSDRLGPISLDIRLRAMEVTVDFDASERAGGLLIREASRLAEELDAHGIRLRRISVRLPAGLRRAILPR